MGLGSSGFRGPNLSQPPPTMPYSEDLQESSNRVTLTPRVKPPSQPLPSRAVLQARKRTAEDLDREARQTGLQKDAYRKQKQEIPREVKLAQKEKNGGKTDAEVAHEAQMAATQAG